MPAASTEVNAGDGNPAHVVAIGGSAGSLEALEQFFTALDPRAGERAAFVVITHLDPSGKGLMPQIVQRFTEMPVEVADEGRDVQRQRVYVIPPDKELVIRSGLLQLAAPSTPRGHRMPIDVFLRTLAEDRGDRSVAVILSGMGNDGTLGARAVKQHFGLTMAQRPDTARFAAMPRSAIEAGWVDHVAAVEELPAKLLRFLEQEETDRASGVPVASSGIRQILQKIHERTGQDFSLYKQNNISRRIDRRRSVLQLPDLGAYLKYLDAQPHEADVLLKDILIGVTSFFREPHCFQALRDRVLPMLLQRRRSDGELRIWVPACSTGEEAYSIAITVREALDDANVDPFFKVQIYATDLEPAAVDRARQGVYPASSFAEMSPARRDRFFAEDPAGYRARSTIRGMIVFAQHNAVIDPPFTKLDLVSCRNMMIYLSGELQKRLLSTFHYALSPGGILMLGSAESVGMFSHLFEPVDAAAKIFSRLQGGRQDGPSFPEPLPPIIRSEISSSPPPRPLPDLIRRVIVEAVSPAVLLVTGEGELIFASQRTGLYLEPPAGRSTNNIFAMAREGLAMPLRIGIRRAAKRQQRIDEPAVKVQSNGDRTVIDLSVLPLEDPPELRGLFLVVLAPAASPPAKKRGTQKRKTSAVAQELAAAEARLHALAEEMDSAQEDLRAANEKLLGANQELQSTNEELTTSREEMQSMNEELMTLNAELRFKNEELALANDDLRNLLNSTQIPTLFLDNDLRIKRFTLQAKQIANLIATDIGRPISDIKLHLVSEDLENDARDVIKTSSFKDKQVQTKNGTHYRMRIHPYRTMSDLVDGVVITFLDLSPAKNEP